MFTQIRFTTREQACQANQPAAPKATQQQQQSPQKAATTLKNHKDQATVPI